MLQDEKSRSSIPCSPQKEVIELLMTLLARRDHSAQELQQKLAKKFSLEEVESVLAWARQQNLLIAPTDLALRMADSLHRKFKGIKFINQYLEARGLPAVNSNADLELEKARHLVKNKSLLEEKTSPDQMAQLLFRRGFNSETIRKVIYEKR
jgi:regulatory protein